MKIYFVRHGETDMNVRNMFYGWYDADINAKGVMQAEELREAFRHIPIDAIYSSDLTRAVHTAEIIAAGRPVKQMPQLRELYYGKWENRTWEEMTEEDRTILKQWRTDWAGLTMPEGESFREFYHRVTEGLEQIIRENKGKSVLVVSHNGALSAMHCHLTGAGEKGFWNFNSKQGHYSAVWVSEQKVTYDCFNYPASWKADSGISVYLDVEQTREQKADSSVIPVGKQFDAFVMTCEENGFTSLQRKRGIHLIFEGNIPKVAFYPVPSLTLFAHDGDGGYFAHTGKNLEGEIFFISKELSCYRLAKDFRTFVQMAIFEPEWKDSITGKKTENTETEEEKRQFGLEMGFRPPTERLSDKISLAAEFRIFENMEKAKEKLSVL